MSSQVVATPLPGGGLPSSPSPDVDLPDLDTSRWSNQLSRESDAEPARLHEQDVDASSKSPYNESSGQQNRQALTNLLAALAPNNGSTLPAEIDATEAIPSVTALQSQITGNASPLTQDKQAIEPTINGLQPEPEPLSSHSATFPPLTELPFAEAYGISDPNLATMPFPELPNPPEMLPEAPAPLPETREIEAFAKIEFEDGNYYLTTYACELGRDALAYRAAQQRAEEAALQPEEKHKSSSGKASERNRRGGDSQVQGSVISNAGGFGGVDEDPAPNGDDQEKAVHPSHSSQVSSSDVVKPSEVLYQPPLAQFDYHKHAELQAQLDPDNEQPAPVTSDHIPAANICPLVPIHATANSSKSEIENHKGISRRHVRIEWNAEDEAFFLKVLGRNGAFVNSEYLQRGSMKKLDNGAKIQISNITATFRLPRPRTEPISDDSDGEGGERAYGRRSTSPTSVDSDTGIPKPKHKGKIYLGHKTGSFTSTDPLLGPDGLPFPPRKRGPGRPPKDGIMSTRERKEREKAAKLAEAKAANGGQTPPPMSKTKINKLPETMKVDPTTQKRPYKKRKREGEDDDVLPSIEGGDDNTAIEAERVVIKKPRASKSPSPDYPPLHTLSEEQLARPSEPYATLIFDILSDIYPKALPLKQIYRALKMKFPFFVYRVESEGWQSSVRHNLNQEWNKLFEKGEKEGKGFAWKAIPGAKQPQAERKRASQAAAAARPKPPTQQKHPPQQQSQHPPINWQNNTAYGPPPHGWQPGPNGHYPPPPPNGLPWPPPPGWQPPPGQLSNPHQKPPLPNGQAQTSSMPQPGGPPPHLQQPASQSGTPQPAQLISRPGVAQTHHSQNGTPQPTTQTSQAGSAAPNMPCTLDGLMSIRRFETAMYDQVSRNAPQDLEYYQMIFGSVKNRLLHGASASNLPNGETKEEVTILNHVKSFIEKFRNLNFVGFKPSSRVASPVPTAPNPELTAEEKPGVETSVEKEDAAPVNEADDDGDEGTETNAQHAETGTSDV